MRIFKTSPAFASTFIFIVSCVYFFVSAKDETNLIKSIDYVFVISFWSYILLNLLYLQSESKKLFVIGWIFLFGLNIFPFTWKTQGEPIEFIIGFSIFLLVVNVLRKVLFYKMSARFNGLFFIGLSILIGLFFLWITYIEFRN